MFNYTNSSLTRCREVASGRRGRVCVAQRRHTHRHRAPLPTRLRRRGLLDRRRQ